MPLGFGSLKDIAKELRGPLWVVALGVALVCVAWAVSLVLCRCD